MHRVNRRSFLAGVGAAVATGGWLVRERRPRSSAPIRVLLITGQNNHDFVRTTELLQAILREAECFQVTVSGAPASGSAAEAWDGWNPDFAGHDVVLSNYNGEMWPERVRDSFSQYVDRGGRVLIQHAANNAFPGWREYEAMVGLLWRRAGEGARLYVDDNGQTVRVAAGEGPGAGHGGLHDWVITSRAEDHPIFRDMPVSWLHAHDELYHGQRGPAERIQLLATAFSSQEQGGSGVHEPMVWWVPFGQGRVLTFLPGHLWAGQENTRAFRCVGFRCMLQRSLQWLATEEVSIPLPDPFPTVDQTVTIEPTK